MPGFRRTLSRAENKAIANSTFDLESIYVLIPELKKYDKKQVLLGISTETEHAETVGDKIETIAKIALDHLKEDPLYYKKLQKEVESAKKNAKVMPKLYYAKHIEPGIVRYEDEDVYVGNDALKKMNKTFAGCPVYVSHQGVNLETLQTDM
ncbi:unnamed protein product, partial [marine sediment metagenome]